MTVLLECINVLLPTRSLGLMSNQQVVDHNYRGVSKVDQGSMGKRTIVPNLILFSRYEVIIP